MSGLSLRGVDIAIETEPDLGIESVFDDDEGGT